MHLWRAPKSVEGLREPVIGGEVKTDAAPGSDATGTNALAKCLIYGAAGED
jgi:hypothetical protein